MNSPADLLFCSYMYIIQSKVSFFQKLEKNICTMYSETFHNSSQFLEQTKQVGRKANVDCPKLSTGFPDCERHRMHVCG